MFDFVRFVLGWSYLRLRNRRLTVVTYHPRKTAIARSYSHVLSQFRFLARNFRSVLPHELNGEIPPQRSAIVAADDGHQDTYHLLFRAARETGVRLVVALPTDFFLRNKWLWFDLLDWAIEASVTGGSEFWMGRDPAVQRHGWLTALKAMPPDRRQHELAAIMDRLRVMPPASPPPKYSPLTREQVREMLASGLVELACHTVSHTIATAMSLDDLAAELQQSQAELEQVCGRPITSFCYPNGLPGDFDERTRAAVADAGFRHAFTCVEGTNVSGCDMLELRRVHAHERFGVFVKMASGLVDVQSRLGVRPHRPAVAATQCDCGFRIGAEPSPQATEARS